MIKADQIPDEVIVAACEEYGGGHLVDMKHAIAAAINAWPFKEYHSHHCQAFGGYGPAAIILPLPTEKLK